VAKAAERRPQIFPMARQYQYLAVDEGSASGFGEGAAVGPPGALLWGLNLWESDTKQDWFKPNGSGRERIIETGRGFLTPRDRSIARAHHKPLDSLLTNQSVDGVYPAGGIAWSFMNPAGLPTDPAALLGVIEQRMHLTHWPQHAADLFDAVAGLLFDTDSPALRAAEYRVLAHLPGVELLGWRSDRLGRRGLTVAITRAGGSHAPAIREELIFDPATTDVLQRAAVLWAPFHQSHTPTLPVGTVMGYTVLLRRGIVDSITGLPGGGRLPYHPSIGARTR
jgi:hypothetical protein